mmetsp:Transcript_37207/g.116489  ORF Transcript_37207/g.116489 Transcript_37207/m.116489 type:complete len:236 (-) Transcript_37207:100-807(-)
MRGDEPARDMRQLALHAFGRAQRRAWSARIPLTELRQEAAKEVLAAGRLQRRGAQVGVGIETDGEDVGDRHCMPMRRGEVRGVHARCGLVPLGTARPQPRHRVSRQVHAQSAREPQQSLTVVAVADLQHRHVAQSREAGELLSILQRRRHVPTHDGAQLGSLAETQVCHARRGRGATHNARLTHVRRCWMDDLRSRWHARVVLSGMSRLSLVVYEGLLVGLAVRRTEIGPAADGV